MVLGDLEALFSLNDRYQRWRQRRGKKPETVADRFLMLFENHGVHRNQIPRFLDTGLNLSDLQSTDALTASLDEPTLASAADRFAVRREWLDGADEQIYPLHDFYKKPQQFVDWLEQTAQRGGNMIGDLFVAKGQSHRFDALLVFQQEIGAVGDKIIYRYFLCDNWMYSYWKSRAYLASCVASAWKRNVYVNGHWLSIDDLDRHLEGALFLEHESTRPIRPTVGQWHPEDLAMDAKHFLDGLTLNHSEWDSTLSLLGRLDSQGLLDAGFGPSTNLIATLKSEIGQDLSKAPGK